MWGPGKSLPFGVPEIFPVIAVRIPHPIKPLSPSVLDKLLRLVTHLRKVFETTSSMRAEISSILTAHPNEGQNRPSITIFGMMESMNIH